MPPTWSRWRKLREQFGFLLVLDEAHAAGVYGPSGAGLAAELGLSAAVDLSVVTLSKAVGVIGGAVCGSTEWIEAVVNFGRAYVFSTSPPPGVAAAVTAALDVMADEPDRQARVRRLARDVRGRLTTAGLTLPPGDSPILPIVLGGEADAVAAAGPARRGWAVRPRHPTADRAPRYQPTAGDGELRTHRRGHRRARAGNPDSCEVRSTSGE